MISFFYLNHCIDYFLFLKEIARREKVLEADVKLPADASKYETEKLAEADLKRVVLEAEATAEAIRV
jgi:flotillin